MPSIKYENQSVFEKYQNLILNESKKGMRRKAQIIEDKIDDFVDEIEKKIDKIEENPTFQTQMYQMLANMNKEHAEFIMALKTICATLDSGAKIIPKTKPVAKGNKVGEQEPGMEETEAEEEEPVEEK
jgi:hypothetical protein